MFVKNKLFRGKNENLLFYSLMFGINRRQHTCARKDWEGFIIGISKTEKRQNRVHNCL